MRCPIDDETLQMTSREGIEIDYCPRCRGVWLDRGELDKLIERSGEAMDRRGAPPWSDRDRSRSSHGYDPKAKRKKFLEDLFDLG